MASNKTFYNVSSRSIFMQQLEGGNIPSTAIAFIKDSREIWAQGIFYPCDFEAPVLPSHPTSETLAYMDSAGYTRNFRVGQACVYSSPESSDGYGIAFLKSVKGGKAVWQDLEEIISKVSDAAITAEEAGAYAKAAYIHANEASVTANAAKNAVATLEGLGNADEAQRVLAGQVAQIAQNSADISILKDRNMVMSEDEYEALELVDQTKIYMLYE